VSNLYVIVHWTASVFPKLIAKSGTCQTMQKIRVPRRKIWVKSLQSVENLIFSGWSKMPGCKAPDILRVASRRIRSDILPRRRVGQSARGVLECTLQQASPMLDTGKDEGNAADGRFSTACQGVTPVRDFFDSCDILDYMSKRIGLTRNQFIKCEAPRPPRWDGAGTAGLPGRKFRSYGAPSCLPCAMLGSGPAGKQGPGLSSFGGRGTFRLRVDPST
jgi:hypothetical protein